MSLQSLKPSVRKIIQKFIFDYWATNERESKRVHHRTPTCERCRLHIETTDHVIQCEQIYNRQLWVALIDQLKEFFKKSRTPPALEIVLLAVLNAWLIGQVPPNVKQQQPIENKIRFDGVNYYWDAHPYYGQTFSILRLTKTTKNGGTRNSNTRQLKNRESTLF